ncbi:MAG: putative addiction module antidote protein, partial [Campylobacteraceae bacterium]|nr:putative addiction module antidote protein [Campylobacteraceae bacterium]
MKKKTTTTNPNSEAEEYLKQAFSTNDHKEIQRSLGDIAKTTNMTKLAQSIGVSRSSLYKSLDGTCDA